MSEAQEQQQEQSLQSEAQESKMSEAQQSSSPVITTEEKPKEKDPKRVAAGKRLAAISKEAKEAKRKRLEEEEQRISWRQLAILSMGIGVLGFAGYKYFFRNNKNDGFVHEAVHMVQQPSPKKEEEPKRKQQRGKPISMFD